MAPSEFLSVPAAAAYLGVSTGTLYSLTAGGKIGHFRQGTGKGVIRYTLADLDAYIASCRVPPATIGAGAAPRVEYHPRGHKHIRPKGQRTSRKGA